MRLNGQKVAIITYTNAACEEISQRLEFVSIFSISTIHSFSWELIKTYHTDIREWLKIELKADIESIKIEQQKGRPGTKIAVEREEKIISKTKRLNDLAKIKKFTYNPNGDNFERGSLNHTEVIKMTASFLINKEILQKILIQRYPIILIDESQDTQKDLIEAFFLIQKRHKGKFCLGLFGDTMQRIYSDGKTDLGKNLPMDWAQPAKKINYRCPKRVIELINKIRSGVDSHSQIPASNNEEGVVRFFIVNNKMGKNKNHIEEEIMKQMASFAGDSGWENQKEDVKVLTLEHHMAARRGGFIDLFEPLYKIDSYKTGLLDGSLPELSFFLKQIIPIVTAQNEKNDFGVTQIVKMYSPFLNKKYLKNAKNEITELKKANAAVIKLSNLYTGENYPKLIDIVESINESGLFVIPDTFKIILKFKEYDNLENIKDDSKELNSKTSAWEAVLNCTYDQLIGYNNYISNNSRFGTHQGVKGLEFSRVMVIIDDDEARGFMFKYDKLFGIKSLTEKDRKNISEEKETSLERTRRLFYVTCSRAEKSLAIVAYTENPDIVKQQVLDNGWFTKDEVILI